MTDAKEVLQHLAWEQEARQKEAEKFAARFGKRDPVNPSHYKDGWSDGAELISITENLTSNGGQAVQYIARSTHIDPALNKSQDVKTLVEDLEKAAWFCLREVKRLKGSK